MNNQLTIKFGGDGNIRVTTLTEFLSAYQTLLLLINTQLGHSPDDLIIEVSPPENGSFKIKLTPKFKEFILNNIGNLLTGTLAGLLVVWTTTSNNNPTLNEIRDILKQNSLTEATPKNVYNIYQNIDARTVINNSFNVISKDTKITNLKVEQNQTEIINVPQSKFDSLIKVIDINEESDELQKIEIIKDEVSLVIKTIHFEGGAKWGFIFRGYPIKASIKAPEAQIMLNNESFRRGDVLKVILTRKQIFDLELGTFIVDQNSYEVEKIIEHKSRESDYSQTNITD